MFDKIIKGNVAIVTKKPKLVLVMALLITLITGVLATKLELQLNWVALAPQGNEAVKEYDRILEEFPTLSNIMIVVESDDIVQMNEAVKELEQSINTLDEYVLSITTGLDQDFVLKNGLLLAPQVEAEGLAYALNDANLESFLATVNFYLEASEPDEFTLATLDEFIDISTSYEGDQAALEENLKLFFSGNPLMLSENGRMTLLTIQPTFDMMDITMLEPGIEAIEKAVKDVSDKYSGVTLQATGMHVVARDETASIKSDSSFTTLLAVSLILAILYFAFRSFSAPIMTFVPLVVGIVWTIGLAQVLIGRLNMMTAFSAVMLLGLGIDYSIHMYSSYTERRANDIEKLVALEHAITISGPGIITGALTTAAAFFALNISQLELLSELGTIMGLGIICTLISVFWILPALLVLKKEKEKKISKIKGHYRWIGKVSLAVQKYKFVVVVLLIISTGFMLNEARQSEFDMNIMNLEPDNLDSINLMNHMVDEYDMSADSFSIAVDSLEAAYKYHKAFEAVDGVKEVVSVASFIPELETQTQKIDSLSFVKDMNLAEERVLNSENINNQLETLKSHLDGDVLNQLIEQGISENYGHGFFESMTHVADQMLDIQVLTADGLPQNYKEQFVSKDGNQFLISVYPDFDVWSNLKSDLGKKFFDDLEAASPKITGTPIFMKVLYESVSKEIFTIGGILLTIIIAILLGHFRSIKYTIYAIIPLILTLIFTVGTMNLIGLKFNMLNFLSLLLIIGIGIDDGVHILHHHKSGMKKTEYLFASVGRAILLTTLTTICGFGSLVFSSYRGIASLGASLSIGVMYALIMTVIVLPLLLNEESA